MLTVQMLKPRLQEYLKAVFPGPSPGPDEKRHKRAVLQAQRDRADSERLFSKGMGNDLAGVKDTLWAAYNDVTEYVDLHRGKFGESKWLGEIWFGAPSVIKARALDEAISLARVN